MATSKKAEPKKVNPAGGTKFALTDKQYRPKAPHNIAAYERICGQLAKGPKTVNQLRTALEYSDQEMEASKKEGALPLKQQKHHDFIGYMERGGYIALAK